jgi:hypothetical protein
LAVSAGKCAFKETDIKRAIRAVRDLGLTIAKVEIGPDGTISVSTIESERPASDKKPIEPAREIVL